MPSALCALLCGLLVPVAACAQRDRAPNRAVKAPPADSGATSVAMRARDIATFVDAFVVREMQQLGIPGAVVVVIDGGRLVLQKGYGFADSSARIPVDPERTIFRTGSVAKAFTAIAALQSVESGRLQLHADVNAYLDRFSVGGGTGGPVTLHQLLVHTAGFDERIVGYATRVSAPYPQLGDYLARRMPPRTRAPGAVASYSNHGFALAGYLVERTSAMPFREYARRQIFEPLGMHRTAFICPPLPDIAKDLAAEYWSSGERAELAFSNPYPAGALGTTGADMGRFMRSWLGAVKGGPSPVFTPAIARWMGERQFTHHPDAPGYAYGLNEQLFAGRRVLLKGGSAPAHSAVIALVPELESGVFVALNRREPQLWTRLLPELVGRFYSGAPARAGAPAAVTVTANHTAGQGDLRRFEGSYRWTRNARRSAEKVVAPFTHVRVTANQSDLSLSALIPLGARWRPAGPLLFTSADGAYLAFRESGHGEVTHLFTTIDGDHFAFERVEWIETPAVQLAILSVVMLTLISFPLVALGRAVRSRLRGRAATGPREASLARLATMSAHAVAALALLFLIGAAGVAANAGDLLFGVTPLLQAVLVVPLLTAAATAVLAFCSVSVLRRRVLSISRRLHLAAMTLAALGFVALLASYNLLGFRI